MIKCPRGVEHEDEAVRSYVATKEPDLDKSIIFSCGCTNRDWTMKGAIRAKVFSPENVERIRAEARRLRAENFDPAVLSDHA